MTCFVGGAGEDEIRARDGEVDRILTDGLDLLFADDDDLIVGP